MTARNLALEALYAGKEARTFSERLKAHALGRAAIAALEAETGEPVAWIDPRDLAVLTCPDVEEFGASRFAGVRRQPPSAGLHSRTSLVFSFWCFDQTGQAARYWGSTTRRPGLSGKLAGLDHAWTTPGEFRSPATNTRSGPIPGSIPTP